MLKPSYFDILDSLNKHTSLNENLSSRYSIVIAVAKRTRQLIDGEQPLVNVKLNKPVSIAINEFVEGKLIINPILNNE